MRNTSSVPSKKRLAASELLSALSLAPSTAPWSALILLIALSATSCKSLTPTPTTLTRQTDTLIVCQTRTDTLIHLRPDSAAVFALLRCDSLGRVLLDSISSLQGRRLRTDFQLHPNALQTAIEVRSLLPPDSLRVTASTTTIRQSSATATVTQTPPAAPSLSSRLGGFLQGLGLILIGIIIGFIARSLI